jgi:membrane protein YdbS with pleckstrin-like domain
MMHLDHLPNQRKNEKVELFLRRHWFAITNIILAFLILTIIPISIGIYFQDQVINWLNHPLFGPVLVVIASIYFLSIWLFAFLEFTDYYLDVWIVTNERIINIEQEGLFHRTASELNLTAVQDVTSDVRGIIRTVFDYGNVSVQTAGETGRFRFKNIQRPEKVKEHVIRLVERDKKRHGEHKSTPEKPTATKKTS